MNEFEFDYDANQVQEELYQEEKRGFPAIAWLGKTGDPTKFGHWSLNVDAVEEPPEPFWDKEAVTFGGDPTEKPTDVYVTKRLRCVPVGVRKRIVITDDAGVKHFYPWMTPKDDRVEGRFQGHFQVMVMLPGLPEPIVIGLRGYTRTVSWSNDPESRYGNRDFPLGVEQALKAYAERASRQKGKNIPWLCAWLIDLTPALTESDDPLFVSVGKKGQRMHMNPFTADLKTGNGKLPPTRFVGMEDFLSYQAIRQEVALPWELEWSKPSLMDEVATTNQVASLSARSNGDSTVPSPFKEDETPW